MYVAFNLTNNLINSLIINSLATYVFLLSF
jgi:hypothetical protein